MYESESDRLLRVQIITSVGGKQITIHRNLDFDGRLSEKKNGLDLHINMRVGIGFFLLVLGECESK